MISRAKVFFFLGEKFVGGLMSMNYCGMLESPVRAWYYGREENLLVYLFFLLRKFE